MGDSNSQRRGAGRPRRHEQATYDLARSACLFSKRMRDVIDDKLGFAAALIRAGDLDAACRLFAELDRYLKGERAALGDGLGWDEEPA